MKRLCKFYNIILRQTVPYSPTSHSLIENANRYVTQLTCIFSDQFQAHWIDVISLAALVFNAIPRPQLSNHSPYFVVFAKECFENNDLSVRDNGDLDVSEYLKRTMNNRIYVRVLRERLLKIREQRNAQKHQKYQISPLLRVFLNFALGLLVLNLGSLTPIVKKRRGILTVAFCCQLTLYHFLG